VSVCDWDDLPPEVIVIEEEDSEPAKSTVEATETAGTPMPDTPSIQPIPPVAMPATRAPAPTARKQPAKTREYQVKSEPGAAEAAVQGRFLDFVDPSACTPDPRVVITRPWEANLAWSSARLHSIDDVLRARWPGPAPDPSAPIPSTLPISWSAHSKWRSHWSTFPVERLRAFAHVFDVNVLILAEADPAAYAEAYNVKEKFVRDGVRLARNRGLERKDAFRVGNPCPDAIVFRATKYSKFQ
jgi:hypothetical protein